MTVAPAQVINLPLATDKMHATQSHARWQPELWMCSIQPPAIANATLSGSGQATEPVAAQLFQHAGRKVGAGSAPDFIIIHQGLLFLCSRRAGVGCLALSAPLYCMGPLTNWERARARAREKSARAPYFCPIRLYLCTLWYRRAERDDAHAMRLTRDPNAQSSPTAAHLQKLAQTTNLLHDTWSPDIIFDGADVQIRGEASFS